MKRTPLETNSLGRSILKAVTTTWRLHISYPRELCVYLEGARYTLAYLDAALHILEAQPVSNNNTLQIEEIVFLRQVIYSIRWTAVH